MKSKMENVVIKSSYIKNPKRNGISRNQSITFKIRSAYHLLLLQEITHSHSEYSTDWQEFVEEKIKSICSCSVSSITTVHRYFQNVSFRIEVTVPEGTKEIESKLTRMLSLIDEYVQDKITTINLRSKSSTI